MQVCSRREVPNDPHALCCRQSRLAGVVRLLVCCGVLSIPLVVARNFGLAWLVWLCAAGALLILPIMLLDLAALFRSSNWILQVGRDGVWINLRSYRDRDPHGGEVLRLRSSEIMSIGRHIEAYSTPSKTSSPPSAGKAVGADTVWRDEFLEIRLKSAQADELRSLLQRLPSARTPGPSSPNKAHAREPFPIWLAGPSVVRICWNSGHGRAVAPRLKRVLARIKPFASVAAPTRRDRKNWRELSADEAVELARELVFVHGDERYSAALLVRVCGMSQNAASGMVRQFREERFAPVSTLSETVS
jgi:hypothetical protein